MSGGYRVTIAGLLWLVAVVGLWLASLRSASVVWTSVAATMTLAALLTAVLGAVLLRGGGRAFCLGFAVFGGVYLALVDWDWVGAQFGHDLTAGLSDWAEALYPNTPAPTAAAGLRTTPGYFESVQQQAIRRGNFVQIGRMSLSLLFATAGGLVGRALAGRDAGPPR